MGLYDSLVHSLVMVLGGIFMAQAATFTFVNRCGSTVWPATLSNAGSGVLDTTGFELPASSSRVLQAPAGWSGRLWARTGCAFDSAGHGSCTTGDCGSGGVECSGSGATPPATLAEFTLAAGTGQDFYDVSLVDGYNLPVAVEPSAGGCSPAECAADVNQVCPSELKVASPDGVMACRSACDAFNKAEYCCSGPYASPAACRPSSYSQVFKSACPLSYSFAFDDPTSTFTCATGADYTITFCPGATPSVKSTTMARDPTVTPAAASGTPTMIMSGPQSTEGTGGVMLQDASWMANLATGAATARSQTAPRPHFLVAAVLLLPLLLPS